MKTDEEAVYILPVNERERKRDSRINFLAAAGLTAVWIAAGLWNPDSSRTFWIVLPYLFLFLPLIYSFSGAYNFFAAGPKMRSVQYRRGLLRIRRSFLAVMALSCINALLDVIYIITHRKGLRLGTELAYCAMFFILIAGVILYGRFYDWAYGGITTEQEAS